MLNLSISKMLVAAAILTSAAYADCTNASVRGVYGYTAQGRTISGLPLPPQFLGPFASSGVAVYDGRGNVTLTATSSFNGVIQPPSTVKATYNVNPDCTYTSVAENGVTFRAVIVDDGQRVLILQTTPGVVITGQADKQTSSENHGRQNGRRCAETITDGVYGFLGTGFAGPPTIPAQSAGPLAGVGTVRFGRDGRFVLNAQRSVNGVLDPQVLALPGSYTLASDSCTFRMQFDIGFTFSAAAVDGGREIRFIETDPGTTFIVTAKRI